jgi:hypothetical protein
MSSDLSEYRIVVRPPTRRASMSSRPLADSGWSDVPEPPDPSHPPPVGRCSARSTLTVRSASPGPATGSVTATGAPDRRGSYRRRYPPDHPRREPTAHSPGPPRPRQRIRGTIPPPRQTTENPQCRIGTEAETRHGHRTSQFRFVLADGIWPAWWPTTCPRTDPLPPSRCIGLRELLLRTEAALTLRHHPPREW